MEILANNKCKYKFDEDGDIKVYTLAQVGASSKLFFYVQRY